MADRRSGSDEPAAVNGVAGTLRTLDDDIDEDKDDETERGVLRAASVDDNEEDDRFD